MLGAKKETDESRRILWLVSSTACATSYSLRWYRQSLRFGLESKDAARQNNGIMYEKLPEPLCQSKKE